ncbi:hypothetical protein OO17_09420 [Rhodopseudomonas palustris]|uniref:Uncharacterized protein n=1 Tax=Rhodopseudomonas palustris TaxID=1076 RepID=A0A0D7EW39_RHOPL|nr:hypothetical protein OO17_09420 [Rhodopseudomonas palustris]
MQTKFHISVLAAATLLGPVELANTKSASSPNAAETVIALSPAASGRQPTEGSSSAPHDSRKAGR